MDKKAAQLESIKMVKDWSVWLVVIQTAICTFLWNVIKEKFANAGQPKNSYDPFQFWTLHLGWGAFAVSAIIGVLIVMRLPYLIETLGNKTQAETILDSPFGIRNWKFKTAIRIELITFLTGVLFIVFFMTERWITFKP